MLIKIALLIAVATSQVFGGGSCCCFGRAVFSSHVVEDARALKTNLSKEALLSTQVQPQRACSKCSVARKGSDAVSRKVVLGKPSCKQSNLHDDRHCRCANHGLTASNTNEVPVIDSGAHGVPVDGSVVEPERQAFRLEVLKYEVPIRFGGHSWQSIACVWKN